MVAAGGCLPFVVVAGGAASEARGSDDGAFSGVLGRERVVFDAFQGGFRRFFSIFFEKSWPKICGIEKSVVILHRFSAHETLVRVSYIFDASCERSRRANVL